MTRRNGARTVAALCSGWAVLALAFAAQAADIVRTPIPNAPAAPISSAVTVPAGFDLVFVSGTLATIADPAHPDDTRAQTLAVLAKHRATLEQLSLGFADVVEAHVFLVGDPAKGGDIDFAGLNAAWSTVFGTPDQPAKPARSTVKVAGLVAPGALVEIELLAARRR
jgi:enamine deaminase RidA (YjgF/YER057c/UK114 family)